MRLRQAQLRLARGRAVPGSRTACASTSQAGIGERGADLRDAWMAKLRALPRAVSRAADQLDRMQRRELPDGWDRDLPEFPADAEGPRDPRVVRAGAERGRAQRALADRRRRRISAPSTKTRLTFDGAGDFAARRPPAAATSTSASASTAMGAIVNGLALTKAARLRLGLPHLQRLLRDADPPQRADGDPGRSGSSRTTRSASARTARRTSRSSSSRRCARSRA